LLLYFCGWEEEKAEALILCGRAFTRADSVVPGRPVVTAQSGVCGGEIPTKERKENNILCP
jgi:hypothetical protein